MKKLVSWFSPIVAGALILAGCVQPTPIDPSTVAAPTKEAAQEGSGGEAAAAGEAQAGGIWRRASIADAELLNPILSSESASAAVNGFLFPGLIGQDPFSGEFTPDGSMSESWEVSEDGLTWTFKLRDGVLVAITGEQDKQNRLSLLLSKH